MKNLFLKIFDFFEKRRTFCILILLSLTAIFVFLATRIKYEEDISKFLPNNKNRKQLTESLQQVTSQNTIALFFSGKDSTSQDEIIDAISDFAEIVENDNMLENLTVTIDQTQIFDLMDAVYAHIPYLLDESDYVRIDSLLKNNNFIENQLVEDKKILMLPSSGTFTHTFAYDPLHLFAPALQKLQNLRINSSFTTVDDYLFTEDGKYGIVTFTSPFGANESKNNAELSKYLDKKISETQQQHPDIEIVAVGAPLIAASNANQIKKDSILAVSIAIMLIFLILIFHYRRISDIIWVGFSVLFGALFALGIISIFKDSVSLIVLGIGSVIIGIAANYPLHFLDDYKELGNRREALKEMIMPLFIGNLTTVAAFFCLVWLDAQAMRDLGLFGSLMLVGTILFTLIFLPHFIRKRPQPSENRIFGKISDIHLSRGKMRTAIFLIIIILTIILSFFSTKTSFDSNLSHINYMTSEQRERMQLLTQIQSSETIYAVAQGDDLHQSVENNYLLINKIKNCDSTAKISGLCNFLPSEKQMQDAADRWNNFWQNHNRQEFIRNFEKSANNLGFVVTSFYPFTSMISEDAGVVDIENFNDFIQPFVDKYVFFDENGCKIVNYVYSDNLELLHSNIDNQNNDYFVFSNNDIGNQLVEMLRDSFNYIGFVCSIVVFVFLLISFRRLELAIIAFLPLAIAWVWILVIMNITGIQFNIVNIILATFIFGQGDDYTIFITEGLLYEYSTGKPRLASYKHSVLISAMIMFAGIGCLIVAKHPALHSLATVTIIGMFTVVLMASFVPPFLFDFMTMKNGKKRKAPVTIKRMLYSLIYGGAFIITAFFIIQPFCFIYFLFGKNTEEKKLKFHKILQNTAQFFSKHSPGVKFTLVNNNNETFEKPAVIVCNHQSHLDILYALSLTPKIVFLTNDHVWRNPLYGYVLRKAECYPVSSGFDENLAKLKDLYERGYSICIFPEGTRSPDCKILRFHKGAFALARELNADILPLYLHGAGIVLPKEELMLCQGFTTLEIGSRSKPYLNIDQSDTNEIDRIVTKKMRQHYIEKYAQMRSELENDEFYKYINYYNNYYSIN